VARVYLDFTGRIDMEPQSPNALSQRIWLVLAVLGAVLCIIGWYRWAS
jgi:hypothetical protein